MRIAELIKNLSMETIVYIYKNKVYLTTTRNYLDQQCKMRDQKFALFTNMLFHNKLIFYLAFASD